MNSYFFLSEPPYLLLLFGLLISVSCGTAFEKLLKQNVQQWYKTADDPASSVSTFSLLIPFIGICSGIFAFLVGGLEIVINTWAISSAIALPLTLLTGRLVWSQLGKLLLKLREGGSQALDLEDLF
jgi:hypothetical protein